MSALALPRQPQLGVAPTGGHEATPPRPVRRSGNGGCLTKVTVNLVPLSMIALDEASTLTRDTETDVINRAIQLYAWCEQMVGAGYQLRLVDHHGGAQEVKLA